MNWQVQPGATETSIPKFATISATTSSAIISAVTARRIRVLAYILDSAGTTAVSVKFSDGASGAGTDLTKLRYLTTTSQYRVCPFSPVGWFQTTTGSALYMNVSAAVQVDGEVVYVETE